MQFLSQVRGKPGISSATAQELADTGACLWIPDLNQTPLEAHPHIPLAVHLHAGHCTLALKSLQLFG